MAMNDGAVVISTRGAVFLAAADTALPNLKLFALDKDTVGDSPNQYTNIGHMSVDDLPSFDVDGGDSNTKDTWNKSNFRVTYDTVTAKVTFTSVQGDADTLKLMFDASDISGGGTAVSLDKVEQKKAVFVYVEDTYTSKKFGIWMPNVSLAYSAMPELSQDGFNTFKLEGNILSSTVLPKTASGKASFIGFYLPADFEKAA